MDILPLEQQLRTQSAECKGTVRGVGADRWAVVPVVRLLRDGENMPIEEEWSRAARLSGFRRLHSDDPAEAETDLRLICGGDCLYVRAELRAPRGAGGEAPFFEQIDLIVSTNGTGRGFYQFPVTFSNRNTDTEAGLSYELRWDYFGPEKSRLPIAKEAYRLRTHERGAERIAELAIPFAAIGASGAREGDEWRFNAVRYREGDAPVSSWAPLMHSYFMDSAVDVRPDRLRSYVFATHSAGEGRMGSLFIGGVPAAAAEGDAGAAPAVLAWTPQTVRLRYAAFGTAELSFDAPAPQPGVPALADLSWRAPSGETTAIKELRMERTDERLRLSFASPPLDARGLVQLHLKLRFDPDDGPVHYAIISFDTERMIAAGNDMFPSRRDNAGKRKIAYAPASDEVKRIAGLIPSRVGFLFAGVPHDPQARTDRVYVWRPERPDVLVTAADGVEYPHPDYPEDRSLTVRNRRGEQVVYPYYEGEDGRRYFVSAHLWYEQKKYAMAATRELAERDPLGAARLLYAWTNAYAGYVPVNDFIWRNYPVDPSAAPPYPYWGGVLERWHIMELYALMPLAETFAVVCRTDAFELLGRETGEDVESKVEEGLLRPELAFADSFPIIDGNMDCVHWLGQIVLGKALNDPDLIHRTVLRMKRQYERRYLADGFWGEISFSYHDQSVEGFADCLRALDGWSDPEGYVSPRSGMRFDKLDLLALFPALERSLTLGRHWTYPDGRYVPVNDTWAFDRNAAPEPTSSERSVTLLPSAGLVKLSRGSGGGETQAVLNFSPKYGHHHADPLGLLLYAEGRELLPDIGYTYTRYRLLFNSTFAHNTVVVNGRDMTTTGEARCGGRLSVLAEDGGVQVVHARQESAYSGIVDEYSRELWSVGFDGDDEGGERPDGRGYVVDLFRVSGGSRHEYTLNGPANEDAVLETDADLAEYGPYLYPPGTRVVEPVSEYDQGRADGQYYAYMYLQNVRRAELDGGAYKLAMTTASGAGLNVHGFVGDGPCELFVGQAASLRATRTGDKQADVNGQLSRYRLPKYVLRREGTQVSSLFMTVMEPYGGSGPRISRVERFDPDHRQRGDAAVVVAYGDTTDIILSSGAPEKPMKVRDMILQGRMGFIRMRHGRVCRMMLIGGTLLQKGAAILGGSGPVTGEVAGTRRKAAGDAVDGIATDADVPGSMKGAYVVVTHPDGGTSGCRIADIVREGGETILVTEADPGFVIYGDGSSAQTSMPRLAWDGGHSFRIDNIERMDEG